MKYPLLLATLLSLTGCIRYYCHAQDSITAYASRDWKSFIDSTATLIKYQKGSNFQMMLDSSMNELQYQPRPDAPFWAVVASGLTPEYDYKIIFRPSGIEKRITNITIDHEKVSRGADAVTSCGGSYTINGVTTNVSEYVDDVSGYTVSTIQIYLYE
ncbi:MAG: hypothetical protein KF744_07745 [Taibaiella sp.]|nr:hypothetical protein [Taibaiella sp.]